MMMRRRAGRLAEMWPSSSLDLPETQMMAGKILIPKFFLFYLKVIVQINQAPTFNIAMSFA